MFRLHALDGAIFPHIIKVKYLVDGQEYVRRKWILTKKPVPMEGDTIQILYDDLRPEKIKLVI